VATVVAVLTSRVQGWGLCNDVDQSCAAWAKAGECDKGDHVKKLCPHSCAICTHLCRDTEESCLAWADNGQCDSNMDFMFKHCPVACGVCKTKCYDKDASCASWSRSGECSKNPSLLALCPASCGVCTDLCLDKQNDCPQWAAEGACGTNAAYMLKNCPNSCQVCTPQHHAASSHPLADGKGDLTTTTACADLDRKQCVVWGEHECEQNPGAMMRDCAHTCGVCTLACEDKYTDCPNWALGRANVFGKKSGKGCEEDAAFMRINCPHSCGVCRELYPAPASGKDEM